jgi:hypothetical protein
VSAFDLAAAVRLPGGCSALQVAKWNGTAWVCAADRDSGGTITAVNAGTGLTGGGSSGSVTLNADTTVLQHRLTGTCSGSGQAIQSVDSSGNPTCGTFWSTTGNSGTSPATTDFLGTTDNQPLNLRVNDARALRLEPTASDPNVIGGFSGNSVTSGAVGATISGGGDSSASSQNKVTDSWGTVGGGQGNQAGDNAGTQADRQWATVAGGFGNTASGIRSTVGGGGGNLASNTYASIGGGFNNTASGYASAVAGGQGNTASGSESSVSEGLNSTASGDNSAVAGGSGNVASGTRSVVSGGAGNHAVGVASAVVGGDTNTANGQDSLAAGQLATAAFNDSFVWGDGSAATTDDNDNEFVARASNGFTFYTATNNTTGAQLAAGSGSWASLSDRHAKAAIHPVSGRSVLRRLRTLPMRSWRYKAEAPGIRHLGPMAQAFYGRFGLGASNRYITDVDAQGVALAAIKGLASKVQGQRARLRSQDTRLRSLRSRVRSQGHQVAALSRAVRRLEQR